MRRRSERGKTKPTKEESPEKAPEKPSRSSRHTRRRRKSSSSSDSESKSSAKTNAESSNAISQPLVIEVPKAETSKEENVAAASANSEATTNNTPDNPPKLQPIQEGVNEGNSKEEEESLWKIQSANGAGDGGEIQKLKICRQRPTESPEIGDAALRKRLGRSAKENRSTDDSTQEESEKESKRSKHRSRTSSRNSPMVSPTVVCDVSGDSPTKIKIINVAHLNTGAKSSPAKPSDKGTDDGGQLLKKSESVEEKAQEVDLANISLPEAEKPLPTEDVKEASPKTEAVEIVTERRSSENEVGAEETSEKTVEVETEKEEVKSRTEKEEVKSKIQIEEVKIRTGKEERKSPPQKVSSPTPSPKRELPKPDSSGNSESSEDESKPRRVKKKRRRDLQSSVQRRFSGSTSPKQESSDSEEDIPKKKEADRRESTELQKPKETVTIEDETPKETPPPKVMETIVEESKVTEVQPPMPRRRRWGSSKANRPEKPVSISTEILKSLVPDAKPVAADELQLSVEEEEGQLMDDEEEDDVMVLMAKEEEKQIEQERVKEEKQKKKEKEEEERRKKRQERQERFEKKRKEEAANAVEKDEAPRKILLLSENVEVKKVSRPPTPPRRKPTNVLYITHLVRPFTVQQLKNLLLRTGTIADNGFWIDKIKSKCYVEYTTEDAAVETRHALHGVKWPTSNPKTLVVEFASRDDMAAAQAQSEETEQQPRKPEPFNMVEGWVAEQARIRDTSRRTIVREWDVGKPEHPDEALEYELKIKEKEKKELERKARKERHHRTPSPEADHHARKARKKDDAPAKLLDDLFRKTKSSPCIYWLPLTQEQIAVKEEMRRQHMAEHERRLAEIKKADQARRDRERRNRK